MWELSLELEPPAAAGNCKKSRRRLFPSVSGLYPVVFCAQAGCLVAFVGHSKLRCHLTIAPRIKLIGGLLAIPRSRGALVSKTVFRPSTQTAANLRFDASAAEDFFGVPRTSERDLLEAREAQFIRRSGL